ncbi:MAG: CHAT domain-containing protein, partial [Candidatus Eisenbacteria bacterium]|nr:CHAT domain-containing protein [Candidatus Eisenbacteria bacterium]
YRAAYAVAFKTFGEDHWQTVRNLTDLARFLIARGDPTGILLLERATVAASRHRESHPEGFVGCLRAQVLLHERREDWATAHLVAETGYKATLGKPGQIADAGYFAIKLAHILIESSDLPEAAAFLEEGCRLHEEKLGADHDAAAYHDQLRARLAWAQGDTEAAETILRRGLGRVRDTWGYVLHLTLRYDLADLLQERGRVAEALGVLQEAVVHFETYRRQVRPGVARATALAEPYARLTLAQLDLGHFEEAWVSKEKMTGRSILELLAAATPTRDVGRADTETPATSSTDEDSATVTEQRLTMELARLETQIEVAVDAVTKSRLTLRKLDLEAERADLHRRTTPLISAIDEVATVEQLQAALAPDAAVLSWVEARHGGPTRTRKGWGCVVRARGPAHWVPLPDGIDDRGYATAAELRDRLREEAHRPLGPAHEDEIDILCRSVWDFWLAPLDPLLTGIDQLIVVPSRSLYGLPLEVLLDSRGARLLERFGISYSPSCTAFVRLQERSYPSRFERALFVGDPPFREAHARAMAAETVATTRPSTASDDERANEANEEESEPVLRTADPTQRLGFDRLPRLPGTRDEIQTAARAFPDATVLLGTEAQAAELARRAASDQL